MSVKQGGKTIAGATQYHPDLFDFKWADHIVNDAQWLMADTFSWQYGSMYKVAYAHLATDIDGKTLQSETVAGITVQFYLADDGHKICPDSEEDKILSIYNKTGNAWYYIIDTTNQRFKLPRRHSQQIVRSVKNADGSWYRLYASGWVEQGGLTTDNESTIHNLVIPMADTNYVLVVMNKVVGNYYSRILSMTTTGFIADPSVGSGPKSGMWQVSGQSAIDISSFQDGEKYLYFYVGSFTQTALENTAGLNASLFNGKADVDLSNAASNASTAAKQTIVGWGMPDLNTAVSVSTSGFTSTKKQWLCIRAGASNNYFNVLVNGVIVSTIYSSASTNTSDWYPLDVGDVVTFAGTSSYFNCATYDMKGL